VAKSCDHTHTHTHTHTHIHTHMVADLNPFNGVNEKAVCRSHDDHIFLNLIHTLFTVSES